MSVQVPINHADFRPGTLTDERDIVFSMMLPGKEVAAMGDMICWMSAIKYVADNYTFVKGHLIVPEFFKPLAENVLKNYEKWTVHADSIPKHLQNGLPLKQQALVPINATGAHLIDLGYIYFMHMNPPPQGAGLYPEIDLSGARMPAELVGERYVVMTPVMGAITRLMEPETYNGICEHLVSRGITPVHMGHTEMKGRQLLLHPEYAVNAGVNLINRTSLVDAALVMKNAQLTLGIDNGLLHLAAMTDATILYGFTIAGPKQRRVRRRLGKTFEIYASKEAVPCLFCQESVRFFIGHDFKTCLYRDAVPMCIKRVDKKAWNGAIDNIVKG